MSAIERLLVANRGEIARRVMRTCREMGIATVAVFSDADAGAPFVAEADLAVRLPGSTAAETYLRGGAIVEAALRTGADAVHPGYGFLSENAGFARACAEAGLTFVGPPADVIALMGSKLEARRLMAEAGVPVLPGEEAGEELDAAGLAALLERVGLPALVKASAGGGGRVMRLVRDAAALEAAVASARREAAAAFGDGTVFLERYVEAPRHVEIQLLADGHGATVHLFERECSIQRRHQKIVEESPSTAVDGELRERMGAAAVTAGRAIGYVGAGTVEFLLGAGGEHWFLEVNTRLQVEHPVTECLTGLDLVRLQLLVAHGEPLPVEALRPRREGHAIEVRLYAEDAERDFAPCTGTLHRFAVPALPGVRVDSGVEDGSVVSTHYDPMLAKVIAHAPTRTQAARLLAAALAGARLHGVTTNRDLLVRILRHPEFLAGATDTHFLERNPAAALGAPLADAAAERLAAVAAVLAAEARHGAERRVLRTLPAGWRNNPSQLEQTTFEGAHGRHRVGHRHGRDGLRVEVDGAELRAAAVAVDAGAVVLEVDGVRHRHEIHVSGGVHHVDGPAGAVALRELPRFPAAEVAERPGSLRAPMPGTVLRVEVAPGDRVEPGSVVAVLEAMKMEHAVLAGAAGQVAEVHVRPGEQVDAGAVIAVVEEG
ncbi:MAG TPA: biotin carboxylase N-terminal domain-containing protein [Candidatus Dormibacteraeota bacterium]|nr:biotin carboxylase N-terminal domain-containing protein [Candidatus Dormibacteraeota bacterium]